MKLNTPCIVLAAAAVDTGLGASTASFWLHDSLPGFTIDVSDKQRRPKTLPTDSATAATDAVAAIEEEVPALFRREYADYRASAAAADTTTEEHAVAWRQFANRRGISPDEGPNALAWRNHRVNYAHGDLRLNFGPPWPAASSPPGRFIDGREFPTPANSPQPLAGWDCKGLTVGRHRTERPAIAPVDVDFSIKDGAVTPSRRVPDFKPTSPP